MYRLRAVAVAGVIPWIPAVPHGSATPALAPPCAAGSLRPDLELQGATGSLAGALVLTNRGDRPCSLRGRVGARFAGAPNPAGVKFIRLPAERQDPGVAFPSLRALRTGQSAFVFVWLSNWCGARTTTRLEFTLPVGEIDAAVPGTARCDDPSAPARLEIGPLQAREERGPAGSRLPLAAAIVEELHLGPKAVPGIRARAAVTAVFHLALTNTSAGRFRFGPICPTYVVGTGLDRLRAFVLNCRPVGSIGRAQTVVFEMRVTVPAHATGTLPLTWELAPQTDEPPFAGGVIVVER